MIMLQITSPSKLILLIIVMTIMTIQMPRRLPIRISTKPIMSMPLWTKSRMNYYALC